MSNALKISDKAMSVDDQIRFYIDHAKTFMLHGPSGIGKSRRVEEIDPNYVSIVLRNDMLPEEVIGKTIYLNNGEAKWIPPIWFTELQKRCEEDKEHNHVLFIDEVTNVKPIIQSMIYDIVLNRRIRTDAQSNLPKNVSIALAGNSLNESNAAYVMPSPLFRRVDGHIYLKVNVGDILKWGSHLKNDGSGRFKMHPAVLGYLKALATSENGKNNLYSDYDSENPPKYAIDPRAWEQISNIIYDNDGVIAKELLENKLGPSVAKAFLAYISKQRISVDDIVNGNVEENDIPTKIDDKIALIYSLLGASESDVGVIREFIKKYIGSEDLVNFDLMWAGDDENRLLLIDELKKQHIRIKPIKKIQEQDKLKQKVEVKNQQSEDENQQNIASDSVFNLV